MKKILIAIAAVLISCAAFAQPRTVGVQLGYNGLSGVYQHTLPSWVGFMNSEEQHLTLNVDLPWHFHGFTATATYDFTNPFNAAFPEIDYGRFDWVLGAGLHYGHWGENIYNVNNEKEGRQFTNTFGIALNCAVEYNFPFPLTLAVAYTPVFGPEIYGNTVTKDSAARFNVTTFGSFAIQVLYRF